MSLFLRIRIRDECQGGLAWTGMTSRTREKRVCIAGAWREVSGVVGHSAFEL